MQKRKVKKAELRMSVLGRKVMTNLVSQSVKLLSRVQLLAIPWTAAYQASPSMGFSRQENWSGVPLSYPCDPMDCSKSGFPVHHQLPELTHVPAHQVGDAIQLSHPLSSPSPPIFNIYQHQGLF